MDIGRIPTRFCQLEALRIEKETVSLLREELYAIFPRQSRIRAFRPEIDVILESILWLGNCNHTNSLGFSLIDLRSGHALTTAQKIGYLLLHFGYRASERLYWWIDHSKSQLSVSEGSGGSWKRVLGSWSERTKKIINLVALLNFVLFILGGKNRTVMERILRIGLQQKSLGRLVPTKQFQTILLFKILFQNGQTFLHHFKHSVNANGIMHSIVDGLISIRNRILESKSEESDTMNDLEQRERLKNVKDDVCNLACQFCCATPPFIPHAAVPCLHVYCYYCIASGMKRFGGMYCLSCHAKVCGMRDLALV